MCVIETGGCGCSSSSSSGASLKGVVMTFVVLGSVVATYRILQVAWPFLLTVWAVAALWVWVPAARPAMRAAAVSPFLLTAWWLRRRRVKPAAPSTEVATMREWQVTVYEPDGGIGGRNLVLTRGVVSGTWRSSTEVEAETIARAVAQFGYASAGNLRAHAQLAPR